MEKWKTQPYVARCEIGNRMYLWGFMSNSDCADFNHAVEAANRFFGEKVGKKISNAEIIIRKSEVYK